MVHNFSFVLPGKLAGMARPGTYDPLDADLDFLRQQNIRAIVNLTETPLDRDSVETAGMAYLHLPVPDFAPPAREQIAEFIDFIDQQLTSGRAVAVHCGAGQGRTGTMLACYLVRTGMEGDEAIGTVRQLRPRSIETRTQEEAVRNFAIQQSGKD